MVAAASDEPPPRPLAMGRVFSSVRWTGKVAWPFRSARVARAAAARTTRLSAGSGAAAFSASANGPVTSRPSGVVPSGMARAVTVSRVPAKVTSVSSA